MTTIIRRSSQLFAMLALAAFVAIACSPMKDPAEAAIADAKNALEKVGAEGQKYAPDQYAAVEEQIAAMKTAFDKKDYEAVLNMVHKVAPNLKLLAETVVSKKNEARIALKDQWAKLSTDLPKSLSAVETRLAELNKTHKLPKGVSKDAVAGAGAAVDSAKQGWNDAQSARTAGNLEDAVAKGKAAEAGLSELMSSLGMAGASTAAK